MELIHRIIHKAMEGNIFKLRLGTICGQLKKEQIEELFKGYTIDRDMLTLKENKIIHDRFIELQYSESPILNGEDIRRVIVYPYK